MGLFISYLVYKMNIQNFVAHLISWHDTKFSTNFGRLHVSRLVVTTVHRLLCCWKLLNVTVGLRRDGLSEDFPDTNWVSAGSPEKKTVGH